MLALGSYRGVSTLFLLHGLDRVFSARHVVYRRNSGFTTKSSFMWIIHLE
jgi:hypothetical protein